MRTTLDIDDDVLQAAKEIAASRQLTAGQVLSELARKGLEPASSADRARLRNGVPILPRRAAADDALGQRAARSAVTPALLDVNLLVALFDPDHIHHETSHDWFADNASAGWATCPVTEAGFVRVLATPAYGAAISRPSELIARLRRFCKGPQYQFWAGDVSLRDETLFDPAFVTSRQITDVYLLGLAKRRRGRLATFDRTIPLKAVVGARRELLEVVAPAE